MKPVLIVVAVLLAVVVVMLVIGALLPKDHVATRSVVVPGTPDTVFALVRDVASAPTWRTGLTSVEGDETRFVEVSGSDRIAFRVLESEPPRRRVTVIDDPSLPFGGTWTWEFAGEGDATRVTVTERGTVGPPLFRFLSRFVLGHDTTLRRVLGDLERKFARPAT